MDNFFDWCAKRKLNPYLEDDAESVDTDSQPQKGNIKTESGASKRSAVRSHAYPPLYGRGQYPQEYFRPIAADAAVYQDIQGDKE